MKRTILLLLLILSLCLSVSLSLASCGQRSILKLVIDEGLSREYELNSTPDFSKVSATATYNDGETVTVGADELEFGKLDTATAGKKNLTITYNGFSITVEVTVKAATLQGGGGQGGGDQSGDQGGAITPEYYIMAAELPETLVAFKTNKTSFTNQDVLYTVGDANPFMLRQKLLILDAQAKPVTNVTRYQSVSKVFLMEGVNLTLVGTDYVTIDEENNTFDFTSAAVGKTFRIQTRPAEIEDDMIAECTATLDVKVVAGYNVTNAKELNLMTNTDVEMNEKYLDADQRDLPEHWQGAIAQRFVDQHFGNGYYNTYGGSAIKGFVLHCDLTPTLADIPEAYVANLGAAGEGFDDSFAVYDRYVGDGTDPSGSTNSFGIYGNCFTINTSGLPMMSDDPDICGSLVASNSWFFRFKNNPNCRQQSVAQAQAFDFTNFTALVENLRMRDDDPNSNNSADNHRHMFGMNALDINMVDATYDNVIIEAYTITTVMSDTNTRLTIKDSVLNNAWQNHIFAWTNNYLQSFYDEPYELQEPWSNIVPLQINVINSKLTKCGGPVVLQQSTDTGLLCNKKTGVELTVDATSELYSYVTGQEAWFEAYSFAKDYAMQIQSMNPLIQNATAGAASITTTRPGNGDTQFMNMVFASLSGNAKYTVNGTVVMDSQSASVQAYKTQGIPAVGGASLAQLGAPLFQSSVDLNATATYLQGAMNTPADRVINTNILSTGNPAVDAAFAQGDTLNLYIGGDISVVLGYFHPAA